MVDRIVELCYTGADFFPPCHHQGLRAIGGPTSNDCADVDAHGFH